MLGFLIILHAFVCIVLVLLIVLKSGTEMFVSQYTPNSGGGDDPLVNTIIKVFICVFLINAILIASLVSSQSSDMEDELSKIKDIDSVPVDD